MKRKTDKIPAKILLAVLVSGLALSGCKGGPDGDASRAKPAAKGAAPVALQGNIESGRSVYQKYCHFCHGQRGTGDGPVGIAITPHPADFVNDEKRMSKTDMELFKSITKGVHRDIGGEEMQMPRWQDILTDQERWDVLAYIRHLEKEGKKAAGK